MTHMNQYIWQLPNWNEFSWDEAKLLPLVSAARLKQGQLIQKIRILEPNDSLEAEAKIFEEETLKTAQIEGEIYNPESVRSSINKRLGLDFAGLPRTERHIDGLVDVLFDATLKFDEPLTKSRIFGWHAALFPTGYSGKEKIQVGKFRTDASGPMQVVSGPLGREKVHYQAPDAEKVSIYMYKYLQWWKSSEHTTEGIIRAGIAHFYYVTIHPFEDGNGRIARALTDMALAQDDKLAKRYYSLSATILNRRKKYYEVLEQSQKGSNDITDWLIWFIDCFSQALDTSESLLKTVFQKSDFWGKHRDQEINAKQRKVLNTILDIGNDNFQGGLTTRKYISIAKVSRATAVRDINDLLYKGMLIQNEGKGRNVNYNINLS